MIEVNGVIYRNLEEQVQKNKEDIENLQNQQSGDDSDIEQINNRITEVETTLTEITPDIMRALKTPISAPTETKLVAVDNTNSQEMLSIGTGLVVENGELKSTDGTKIIDNLTSSNISAGLSANQGRVLDNKISSLNTLVESKANQSSLDTTNQNISQLNTLVESKANQSSLDTTNQNISQIQESLTEITPDIMRALKTPISAPTETKLVAVDNTNSQEMLSIGTGLVVENGELKSTGGTEIIDNLTSSSISAGLSANQGRVLDNKITTLSQNVSQNTSDISTIKSQISSIDSQTSTNTEDIEFLQSDVAGKTNVTINNVHQDYVNFSSDPQTQLNDINTNKANKNLSNVTYPSNTIGSTTTGAGDRVIETYISSDGQTWYRKYASGWKECGGTYLENAEVRAIDKASFELPLAFSNLNYNIQITPRSEGNSAGVSAKAKTQSNIRLIVYGLVDSDRLNGFFWKCCGY